MTAQIISIKTKTTLSEKETTDTLELLEEVKQRSQARSTRYFQMYENRMKANSAKEHKGSTIFTDANKEQ